MNIFKIGQCSILLRAMCLCQSWDLLMCHVLKFHLAEVSAWAELHIVSDMGALDIGFAIKNITHLYKPEILHK